MPDESNPDADLDSKAVPTLLRELVALVGSLDRRIMVMMAPSPVAVQWAGLDEATPQQPAKPDADQAERKRIMAAVHRAAAEISLEEDAILNEKDDQIAALRRENEALKADLSLAETRVKLAYESRNRADDIVGQLTNALAAARAEAEKYKAETERHIWLLSECAKERDAARADADALAEALWEVRDSYHDNTAGGFRGAGDRFADAVSRLDALLAAHDAARKDTK